MKIKKKLLIGTVLVGIIVLILLFVVSNNPSISKSISTKLNICKSQGESCGILACCEGLICLETSTSKSCETPETLAFVGFGSSKPHPLP